MLIKKKQKHNKITNEKKIFNQKYQNIHEYYFHLSYRGFYNCDLIILRKSIIKLSHRHIPIFLATENRVDCLAALSISHPSLSLSLTERAAMEASKLPCSFAPFPPSTLISRNRTKCHHSLSPGNFLPLTQLLLPNYSSVNVLLNPSKFTIILQNWINLSTWISMMIKAWFSFAN